MGSLKDFPTQITEDLNAKLVYEVRKEEVYEALKEMHPSKALGLDGLSPAFYQKFRVFIADDVVNAIRECLFSTISKACAAINHTYVTLIPKVPKPTTMRDICPISLCNVLYKLGSKVLANP